MNRTITKFVALLALVALVTVALAPGSGVDAQDDADALRDRAIAAMTNFENSTNSFHYSSVTSTDSTVTIEIAGFGSFVTEEQVESTIEADVIRDAGDGNPNVTADVTYSSSSSSDEGQGPEVVAVDLLGQLRLVDDVVYINAELQSSEGDIIEPPAGWTVLSGSLAMANESDLNDMFLFTGLEDWDFGFLFDLIADADMDDEEIADFEEFLELADSIEVTQDELPDGTPVDVLVLTVTGPSLIASGSDILGLDDLGADGEDPAMMEFMTTLFESVALEANLAIDENDVARGTFLSIEFDVATEDLGALLGEELGEIPGSLSFNISSEIIEIYSDLNADFSPAEAPAVE